MIISYLKLSFRLLARNPFFTTLNVLGLAIGFSSFYALWEYATIELKADQFHTSADKIARIGINWRWTDDGGKTWGKIIIGTGNAHLVSAAKEDFPEIDESLRILNQPAFYFPVVNHSNEIVFSPVNQKIQPQIFKEEGVVYSDPNLFTFLSIPLIHGQAEKVLNEVNSVVLSRSVAKKYFGTANPTGELLRLNDTITLKVSGIFEDLPHHSHLNFDIVISNVGLQNRWNAEQYCSPVCYVRLNNGNFKEFETRLNARTRDYFAETLREWPNVEISMFVQPLTEIAYSENLVGDNFFPKSRPFLYTLAFISLSVLVMAWVNYINHSITQTAGRLKEIAARKVNGAGTSNMVGQFITEATVTNLIAIAVAFTLVQAVRAPSDLLLHIHIAEFTTLSPGSIAILIAIIVSGITLSGLYPAAVSISFPARMLLTMTSTAPGKRLIPSLLTISQLTAAIIFILLGFIISLQLHHVLNMDLGLKTEEVVVIDAPVIKPTNYNSLFRTMKEKILTIKEVKGVTLSQFATTEIAGQGIILKRPGSDLFFGMDHNIIDENFLSLYEIKLLAGRNFNEGERADNLVISQFAAERLGFATPEEAVGQVLNLSNENSSGEWRDSKVIGVFQDFRVVPFLNLSQSSSEYSNKGRGIVFAHEAKLEHSTQVLDKISVRVAPKDFAQVIKSIQNEFDNRFPGNLFTWYFLNDRANQAYANEKVARNQIVLFTGLAIFIACLGLLAMISSKVIEKRKEIGIRKVLGARLDQIARILLKSTLRHIIIASVVGIPLAYYLADEYLHKYSERIQLHWWQFTLPVFVLALIMLATIASQLWTAARSNPVDALKYE